MSTISEAIRRLVRHRANERCEFCLLPQSGHEEILTVDHIVARKHHGSDDDSNLALCCLRCNLHKGTDLTAIDPESHDVVRLFHPRQQTWAEHFAWNGSEIAGLTATGRATVALLQMNAPARVLLRDALIQEGQLQRE